MFCPSCGLKDTNANQFCRACGTNLRPVRLAVEKSDSITQSAETAREEIGRAFAAQIRQMQGARELKKVVEDVLPEIEKFLESPEEKRLRRIRVGTLLASIGFGAALAMAILSTLNDKDEFPFLAGLGLVTFFIGIGFILNAVFATVPHKTLADNSSEAETQRVLDGQTNELVLPEARQEFVSVVENTTRHLEEKQSVK